MKELTPMNIYLGAAIGLIPQDELMALLSQYGIEEKPTVGTLNGLIEEYDSDFLKELASLAKQHVYSPSSIAKLRKAQKRLSKGTGAEAATAAVAAGEAAASTFDNTAALGWFNAVTNVILSGAGSAKDIISAINGDASKVAEAQWAYANLELEKEKTTRTMIWASIGLVVTLILFFIFYKMFSRH